MISNFATWYEEEKIHDLLETWTFPEDRAIKAALPYGLHKYDKLGRPVFIRRVGVVDFDAFFKASTPERVIRHITWQNEEYKYLIYPTMTRIMGKHIESNAQIFDLTEGNVRKLASRQCLNLIKLGAQVSQDCYPETMGAVHIVNAPMLFSALYAIIKGFLDERTRSKVRIIGANYRPYLLEQIDA